MDDIHHTARGYFLVKIANGRIPLTVQGGPHDGLRYFIEEVGGRTYWVSEVGLFTPSDAEDPGDGDGPPRST